MCGSNSWLSVSSPAESSKKFIAKLILTSKFRVVCFSSFIPSFCSLRAMILVNHIIGHVTSGTMIDHYNFYTCYKTAAAESTSHIWIFSSCLTSNRCSRRITTMIRATVVLLSCFFDKRQVRSRFWSTAICPR